MPSFNQLLASKAAARCGEGAVPPCRHEGSGAQRLVPNRKGRGGLFLISDSSPLLFIGAMK